MSFKKFIESIKAGEQEVEISSASERTSFYKACEELGVKGSTNRQDGRVVGTWKGQPVWSVAEQAQARQAPLKQSPSVAINNKGEWLVWSVQQQRQLSGQTNGLLDFLPAIGERHYDYGVAHWKATNRGPINYPERIPLIGEMRFIPRVWWVYDPDYLVLDRPVNSFWPVRFLPQEGSNRRLAEPSGKLKGRSFDLAVASFVDDCGHFWTPSEGGKSENYLKMANEAEKENIREEFEHAYAEVAQQVLEEDGSWVEERGLSDDR